MKFIIVFVALFALACAAPPKAVAPGSEVLVIRSESDVGPESFKYGYETSDGTASDAEGHLANAGSENEAIQVKGSYRFIGDDGVTYEVNYIADENGFQPSGAHIPHA